MKLNVYQHLINCRFLSSYKGEIESYSSDEKRAVFHNFSDINKTIIEDLDIRIDYRNCIILFPVSTGIGTNLLLTASDNYKLVIDHITYILDVTAYLHKQGIRYKNGYSLIDDKFKQINIPALIIQDGIAYMSSTANLNNDLSYHYPEIEVVKPIRIDSNDKLTINDKEIIFSGILVDRIRKNRA